MGRSRTIPRYRYCLQDDQTGVYCPKNPSQPLTCLQEANSSRPPGMGGHQRPLCSCATIINEGQCQNARCRFSHDCRVCGDQYPQVACMSTAAPISTWPRSPVAKWMGMTPNLFMCSTLVSPRSYGPINRPFPGSSENYWSMTSGCLSTDDMFCLADFSWYYH